MHFHFNIFFISLINTWSFSFYMYIRHACFFECCLTVKSVLEKHSTLLNSVDLHQMPKNVQPVTSLLSLNKGTETNNKKIKPKKGKGKGYRIWAVSHGKC